MKLFSGLAKELVNTATKAATRLNSKSNPEDTRQNLSKKVENWADFLETDKEDDKEAEKYKE